MPDMRAFTKEFRLQALSLEGITEAFDDATRTIAKNHKFLRRKLKPGPLLNALVLSFLNMPEDARESVAAKAIAELEYYLAETDVEREEALSRTKELSGPQAGQTPTKGIPGKAAQTSRRRKGAG